MYYTELVLDFFMSAKSTGQPTNKQTNWKYQIKKEEKKVVAIWLEVYFQLWQVKFRIYCLVFVQ